VFRLAHVTDPHFRGTGGLAGVGLGDLRGKRVLGAANLVVKIGRAHV
jgi:hypothetical protein